MSVPWPAARDLAGAAAAPLPAVTRPLAGALGHRLAAPLPALVALPPFATAAMDGWAVAGPGPWQVLGRVAAGSEPAALQPGQAVEIATGAMVPANADAVLAVEQASRQGLLHGPTPPPGQHVRPAAEEAEAGRELAPAGALASPVLLGLAAAAGYDTLRVHPRPRVAVLVTGDELLPAGLPTGGRIRDSLGPLLPGLIAALGAELHPPPGAGPIIARVSDRPGALADALRAATAGDPSGGPDVVVTTGSTSVGPADQLRPVLAALGAEILIDGVACRPGHPQLLALLPGGIPLLGLPGNPLAAVAAALTLLAPLLAALTGALPEDLPTLPLRDPLPAHPALTRLLPIRLVDGGEGLVMEPAPAQGPAMLRGLAAAAGFAVLAPAQGPTARAQLLALPWHR